MADTKLAEDSRKFLELLLSSCEGADEHSWRTCQRCLALDLLDQRDPMAVRLVKGAILALKERV